MLEQRSHMSTEDMRYRWPVQAPPITDQMDMDALCYGAVAAYREAFDRIGDDHPWTRLPDDDFLMRLNAAYRPSASDDIRPTCAGVLMFGYEHEIAQLYPGYVLDYRRESKNGSVTKRIVSNDGSWSGCLFDFWRQVSPLLSEAMGGRAPDRSKADDDSLAAAAREGLANALAHSDYAGRRHLVVVQRADRLEFSNPGGLRVRASDAFGGGISDPRNPYLMKMLALIGACTGAGRGLSMVRRASERAGVPEPVLSQQSAPDRTTLVVFAPASPPKRSAQAAGPEPPPLADKPPEPVAAVQASPPAPAEGESGLGEVQVIQAAFVPLQPQPTQPQQQQPQQHLQAQPAPARTLGESEAAVTRAMSQASDPDARAALALFRDKKRIRRSDVEELLGVGSTKAKAVVAALVSDGIISAEGGGRSTLYRLKDAL